MASPGAATIASVIREKTSRNKRKFRADPPSPLHFSHENVKGVFASGGGERECLNWSAMPESMGAVSASNAALDSSSRDPSSMSADTTCGGSSFVSNEIERLRWAKAVQARGNLIEGGSLSEVEDEDEEDDDEEEEEEFDEVDEDCEWDDCTEGELEDLLMKNLEAHYNDAVGKIVARGLTRDEALNALSKHLALHGGRIVYDTEKIMFEDAMTLTDDWGEISDQKDQDCLDLTSLQRRSLSSMLFELQKNRPGLSRGDALWCLLVSDMNVEHARSIEDALPNSHSSPHSETRPGSSISPSADGSAVTSPKATDPLPIPESVRLQNVPPLPNPPEISLSCSPTSQPVALSIPPRNLSSEVLATDIISLRTDPLTHIPAVGDASLESTVNCDLSMGQPESSPLSTSLSTTAVLDLSQMAGNVLVVEESKREEGDTRTSEKLEEEGEESGSGDGLFDLPADGTGEGLHQEAVSSALSSDETRDRLPETGVKNQRGSAPEGGQPEIASQTGISSHGASTKPIVENTVEDRVGGVVSTGPAETDLSSSVSTPSESSHGTGGGKDDSRESTRDGGNVPVQDNLQAGVNDIEARRAETLLSLQIRVGDLETQLKDRTEWAQQKVMQAARRLSKDLHELKSLRAERDEAIRVKKDQKALEDSTMKKLAEMETALRKVSGQVDRANAAVRRLENENAEVRAEMEAAKLSAAESVATCQEVAKREKKGAKRAQGWEKQKAKLQEDLAEERRKLTHLQNLLTQAKERQQQAEVRWRQEEKAKEEAVARADNEKRGKEQAEAAFKRREEASRRKAEQDKQRLRDDVERLTLELSSMRAAECAHFAMSSWGSTVTMSPAMGGRVSLKEMNERLLREVAELQDLSRRDVLRDRECVMCMCEEMSVVFLPCAHQVVCLKCNELHEKQGMRDCPSCRTPIQQRIRVYGASF